MEINLKITDPKIVSYLKHYAEANAISLEEAASSVVEDYLLERYPTYDFVEKYGESDINN